MADDEKLNDHDVDSQTVAGEPAITSLDNGDDTTELDVTPEVHVADSLQAALKALREETDELEKMPIEQRVAAAERIAEEAAALDEQIGSIARKDDS